MKSVPYTPGLMLYPPRPKTSIPPAKIGGYEKKCWVAQRKFNGTRTVIYQTGETGADISMLTRHRTPHKQYMLTKDMRTALESLGVGPLAVLDGELMHNKTRGLKNTIVLFDILVLDGEYLIGSTYAERYSLLWKALGGPKTFEQVTGHSLALHVVGNVWLAENFMTDLTDRFNDCINLDEIEGLVIKNPGGTLDWGTQEANNGSWQVRCRKPHKNYRW